MTGTIHLGKDYQGRPSGEAYVEVSSDDIAEYVPYSHLTTLRLRARVAVAFRVRPGPCGKKIESLVGCAHALGCMVVCLIWVPKSPSMMDLVCVWSQGVHETQQGAHGQPLR